MYRDILLCVDLEDESSWRKALPTAVEYCRAFGSRLHVLTVIPDYEAKLLEQAGARLHELVREQVPEEVKVQHIVAQGTIYHEIIQAAEQVDADLIVMASHRPELEDYLIGPNATRVVRHCNRSVLVVRN
jgi:nucleotide-binding universal stress UspA family protein